jgi:hypothetical protein
LKKSTAHRRQCFLPELIPATTAISRNTCCNPSCRGRFSPGEHCPCLGSACVLLYESPTGRALSCRTEPQLPSGRIACGARRRT